MKSPLPCETLTREALTRGARLLLCLGLLATLAACETVPAPPSGAMPDAAAMSASDAARIEELLALGNEALKNDRLTVPAGESAVDRYNQVFEIDADNRKAKQGINRVVDRYIVLARAAVDESNWPRAKQMASRARSVGKHRSEPEVLERQIDLIMQATGNSVEFTDAEVQGRGDAVAEKILAYGALAKHNRARVEIRAPSDEVGQWMYDQLNRAPGRGRVRAFITTGSPPKITLRAR